MWSPQPVLVFESTVRQNCLVALLPFETRAFTTPAPPAFGKLPVSPARLIWGATTVGATPVLLRGRPRPFVELCWRAAMAGASVSEDSRRGRWVKSASYKRLDRSEKSAISYFLGMTQAKITCEMLLGVPHLVHLDAVLALLGRTTKASRPDFVGFDLSSMACTIAVEAKGRTNGRTDAVTNAAKRQAGLLPAIVGTTSKVRVASVASFDSDGHWNAYLQDPPGPYESLDSLSANTLLVAYYRPLVAALLTAGANRSDSDESTSVAYLPGIDLSLGLPRAVVNLMADLPASGPVEAGELEAVGAALFGEIMELPGKFVAGDVPETWQSRGRAESDDPSRCTGFDGVQIILDD